MSKHIMLDLETLGTDPYSVILSIGAVHFDPGSPGIFRDSFEVLIDPKTSMAAGLRVDPDTLFWWWDTDRDAARRYYMERLKFELPLALQGFSDWLGWVSQDPSPDPEKPNPEVLIWGNGANFDNVLLANAYKAARMDVPWKFYQDRCFRTIKGLDPLGKLKPKGVLPGVPEGIAHTALADAFYQAAWMQNICDHLKLEVK